MILSLVVKVPLIVNFYLIFLYSPINMDILSKAVSLVNVCKESVFGLSCACFCLIGCNYILCSLVCTYKIYTKI